ncbi:33 kDa inner dynein arm light chain, axonemal [Histomonas meleagridis]|uniref:33 kDa inner dynein arm light chain, axonemal n=1 Tax=Histomonas meleagridis TaxID=135588 RepID=UPI00355A5FE9|nr:33 kDa inner dynein arm light chain, axonemal [Histomonas meleagridis]KAH0801430.1 33 kDa inner dynein arm light chain, axonemal [Histomonas meleagridis]
MKTKHNNGLLKYDVPILEGTQKKRVSSKTKKSGDDEDDEELTREVLNSILPPQKIVEDGETLTQFVSIAPTTRSDVLKLQSQLDSLLNQRKARNTGICPIRSELYAQCFDEIIRQITIDCSARGKLLVKVRDEQRKTIQSYQELYDSAIAWGIRKVVQIEQRKKAIEKENHDLREEKRILENKVQELQDKITFLEKNSVETRKEREKQIAEETSVLKRQNAQIKAQLDQIVSTK